jgi:hypothetical protein
MPLWKYARPAPVKIGFFNLGENLMMTGRNPAAWTEWETRRDVLDGKLQLLNSFIELHPCQGTITEAVAKSLLAGIESARADSVARAAAMNRLAAAL